MTARRRGRVPFVAWSKLEADFYKTWEPGHHMTVLGPTQSGKSTLTLYLALGRARSRVDRGVIVLGTKPRDPALSRFITATKAAVVKSWDEVGYAQRKRRVIVLWPDYGAMSTAAKRNKPVYVRALDGIVADGRWTLVVDEAIYLVEQLGMRHQLDELWNAAATNEVTVEAGAQRGSWINRSMVSQMTFLATFRFFDEDDAKRAAEIGGDRTEYPTIMRIPDHQFLLRHTRSGSEYLSKLTSTEMRKIGATP